MRKKKRLEQDLQVKDTWSCMRMQPTKGRRFFMGSLEWISHTIVFFFIKDMKDKLKEKIIIRKENKNTGMRKWPDAKRSKNKKKKKNHNFKEMKITI